MRYPGKGQDMEFGALKLLPEARCPRGWQGQQPLTWLQPSPGTEEQLTCIFPLNSHHLSVLRALSFSHFITEEPEMRTKQLLENPSPDARTVTTSHGGQGYHGVIVSPKISLEEGEPSRTQGPCGGMNTEGKKGVDITDGSSVPAWTIRSQAGSGPRELGVVGKLCW